MVVDRQCTSPALLHLSVYVGMCGNTVLKSDVRNRLLFKARCRVSGFWLFFFFFSFFSLPEDALFMAFTAADFERKASPKSAYKER